MTGWFRSSLNDIFAKDIRDSEPAVSGNDDVYYLPFQEFKQSDSYRGGETVGELSGVWIDKTGSILYLGASRSGKTEAMKHVAYQMIVDIASPGDMTPNPTALIVYDYKDDWREFFGHFESSIDLIRLSGENSTHVWNLFLEASKNRDFDVIGRLLFPRGAGDNKFFQVAARQSFAAACKVLNKEFRADGKIPTNADLVNFFRSHNKTDAYEVFDKHGHVAAASALDPDAEGQTTGVWAQLQQEIMDTFVEDFGMAPGDRPAFCLSAYFKNPRRGVVLLDHSHGLGDAVDRVFRFLIDRSAGIGMNTEMDTYYLLDEFARVPHLRNIGDLMNAGAGKNVRVLAALQSRSQLDNNYDEDQADAISAGFITQVFLRLNDEKSVDVARDRIGTKWVRHQEKEIGWRGQEGYRDYSKEEHSFARGQFNRFDQGVAVVVRPDGWIHGYVPMLGKKTREMIDDNIGVPYGDDRG